MRNLALAVLVVAFLVMPADAQEKPKGVGEFNAFLDKPREGWEWDKDERLDDLILQLQEKELALQAVDIRTAKLLGRQAGTKMSEAMAWRAMDRMDLNAGGPIRWDAFYGRNAESFFYHPVDPNTTYHTNTVLQQVQPTSAGGVPGNQGVPAHQRPPQFDYMYRGYERRQDKAKADASEIANKVEVLKERRRQLEQEVVLLWTKIAFRVLDREKVAEKPVLRWASLPVNGGDKRDSERSLAFNEASRLLAIALLFNEQRVEGEADKVFRTVSTAIQSNRKSFEDSLLRAGDLLDDSEDKTKPIGQYKFLSRKLEDTAKTLSEGYRGWQDGDANDDEPTKFVGLRRIQDSLVTYAKMLLALNELVDVMKKDWGLKLNPDSTEFVPTWDVAYTARPIARPAPVSMPKDEPASSKASTTLSGLSDRLKGKSWRNTNNAVFAWDEQGTFTHNGNRREWVVAGGNSVTVKFGEGHVDTLIFSDDMQTFQQFSTSAPQPGGRPLFVGKREVSVPKASDARNASKPDPILGPWQWFNGGTKEMLPDGKIKDHPYASWRPKDANGRTYVISWQNGRYVDTLVLSPDGRWLRGRNNEGMEVSGERAR